MLTLLPADWQELAKSSGGVRRLRGAASLSSLLHTLLLHIAHGSSLCTTSVVAKAAGWADRSDVALFKKLRACEGWLCALCVGLLRDSGMCLPQIHRGLSMRLVDSTMIKEPGDTGSQWRVLYSLRVPDWQCDDFRLTSAKGVGNGESLKYFTIQRGDCLLADRGFSQLAGIEALLSEKMQRHTAALSPWDGRWMEQDPPAKFFGVKVKCYSISCATPSGPSYRSKIASKDGTLSKVT